MLTESFPEMNLREWLVPLAEHRPFPVASDVAAWQGLLSEEVNRERQAWLLGQVEAEAKTPWPELPARAYMRYVRDGDRKEYENAYFLRRARLGRAVLACCWSGGKEWLDEVIDGVWTILSEPTWCVPAHAPRKEGDPLPSIEGTHTDLFCCETGFVLAETVYLLRQQLEAGYPSLMERVVAEVDRRVISYVETQGDAIGWFNGFNNWTPWCASNVLGAACYLLEDRERLARLAVLLNVTVDRFIARYGDDGGCDEGPMYWGRAAASMADYMHRLEGRLDREVELFKHPKVKAMAEFFCTAQLHEEYVLNFADAPARGRGHAARVYLFGKRVGSSPMMDLAMLTQRGFKSDGRGDYRLQGGCGDGLHSSLLQLWSLPVGGDEVKLVKPLTSWLPDLQVAVLRESPTTSEGLILGAKAGHNAESHNHNDVGHFIVMLDGQPGLVDVGTATYTRFTFGPKRYELWYIRGSAHNVPVVNGFEQEKGDARARDVSFVEADGVCVFRQDMAPSYPAEAGVKSLQRSITFDRGRSRISVEDAVEVDGEVAISICFYTPQAVSVNGPRVVLETSPRKLVMVLDEGMSAAVEQVELTDALTRSFWGDFLNKVTVCTSARRYRLEIGPEA